MIVVKELSERISLNKSLSLAGVSKSSWYYSAKPRNIPLNKTVSDAVQRIGNERPTYGTRRMAVTVSRKLSRPINRKQIRRIFHKLRLDRAYKIQKRDHKIKYTTLQADCTKPTMADRHDLCLVWN